MIAVGGEPPGPRRRTAAGRIGNADEELQDSAARRHGPGDARAASSAGSSRRVAPNSASAPRRSVKCGAPLALPAPLNCQRYESSSKVSHLQFVQLPLRLSPERSRAGVLKPIVRVRDGPIAHSGLLWLLATPGSFVVGPSFALSLSLNR